nr:hypothetical protein [Tanacetum cinerariifolium]
MRKERCCGEESVYVEQNEGVLKEKCGESVGTTQEQQQQKQKQEGLFRCNKNKNQEAETFGCDSWKNSGHEGGCGTFV